MFQILVKVVARAEGGLGSAQVHTFTERTIILDFLDVEPSNFLRWSSLFFYSSGTENR